MKRSYLGRTCIFYLSLLRICFTLSLMHLKCYPAIPLNVDYSLVLLCSFLPSLLTEITNFVECWGFQVTELSRNNLTSSPKRKWFCYYVLLSDQKFAGSWAEGIVLILWLSELCSSERQKETVENDWTLLSGMDSMTNWPRKQQVIKFVVCSLIRWGKCSNFPLWFSSRSVRTSKYQQNGGLEGGDRNLYRKK